MINIESYLNDLNDALSVLEWKIDGAELHGIYPNTYLGLTKHHIVTLYNVEYSWFNIKKFKRTRQN